MKKFSTTSSKEEPIDLDGQPHVLRACSTGDLERYQTEAQKGLRADPKSGLIMAGSGQVTSDSLLVSLCLYKADPQGQLPRTKDGKPDTTRRVTLDVIKEWPPNVKQELADMCRDLCGLEKDLKTLRAQRARLSKQIEALEVIEAAKNDGEDEEKN